MKISKNLFYTVFFVNLEHTKVNVHYITLLSSMYISVDKAGLIERKFLNALGRANYFKKSSGATKFLSVNLLWKSFGTACHRGLSKVHWSFILPGSLAGFPLFTRAYNSF